MNVIKRWYGRYGLALVCFLIAHALFIHGSPGGFWLTLFFLVATMILAYEIALAILAIVLVYSICVHIVMP